MDKRIIRSILALSVLIPGCVRPVQDQNISFPSPIELHNLARKESKLAVHPGIPGKTPFWNAHAERFIYAPAFNIPETESADNYRFSILQEGGTDTLTFIAEKLWAPLSPIWDKVKTGSVQLLMEALNKGKVIAITGERVFYRASPGRGHRFLGQDR